MSESQVDVSIQHHEQSGKSIVESLKSLSRIASISSGQYPREPLESAANAVKQILIGSGLANTELLEVEGAPPYVFGSWTQLPNAPTVLLYAHYDVQPAMREELWDSPAFEPAERGGRLFGRGVSDDKAGVMVHAAAIASYLKTQGNLPVNTKVLIDGEEEVGSPHLGQLLDQYGDKLRADSVVIMDGGNHDTGKPSITTSLRGLVAANVTVSALEHPLHSGMWGGPIPDPAMALCKMLEGMVDENGKLTLPGIWEMVQPATENELKDMAELAGADELFRKQAGVLPGVKLFANGRDRLVKMWREPSLIVNSIQSGDRKTAGNVIMDSAWARVAVRTVPSMEAGVTAEAMTEHLKRSCPWGLKVKVDLEDSAEPWVSDVAHPVYSAAKKALCRGYQADAVYEGCGASIPFIPVIQNKLGKVPILLLGVEDPYGNAHSENESLGLADFHKAIKSEIHLLAELGKGLQS